MKTGRNILISAVLALSAGGSIATAAVVTAAPAASALASAPHGAPDVLYHG